MKIKKNEISFEFQQAVEAHQKGQFEVAEKGYTEFLQKIPNHADTFHLLGCLKKQQNKYIQAIQLIQKAIDIAPQVGIYYYNLGLAYFTISEMKLAINVWKKLIDLAPDFTDAYANIGYAYIQQNEYKKAQEILQQGYKQNSKNQLVLLNLATTYHRKDDFDHARQYYEELLSINPNQIQALKNYSQLLYQTGHLVEAINCLTHLTDIKPNCADTWYQLGCVYQDNFQEENAIQCFKTVLTLDIRALRAYYNLGNIEKNKGQLTLAKKYFQTALEINPNFVEILVLQGLLYLDMADFKNAYHSIQKALQIKNNLYSKIASILLYSLNFMPNYTRAHFFREHLKWGNDMIKHCNYQFSHHNKKKSGPIKIGYVSPDFRVHSVAYFILPVLRNHDARHFKIYIYANVGRADHMTEKIRQHCQVFRNIRGMQTKTAAQLIYQDQLDILIDLAGHTHHNRLDIFAMKPAPIQMTYLGYPASTGLSTIDYRLTDSVADPEANDAYYTEILIKMKPPFICYQPPDNAPEISELPMNINGYITFGSFNYLGKTNDYVIQLWIKLLEHIPDARLILKSRPFHDRQVRQQFQEKFISNGIHQNRLDFRGVVPGLNQHLSQYSDIDIALDTFPYNGTTTTCESLWMGVPVLTSTGECHAARVGTTLMQSLGLNDWVAKDETDFVQKACLFSKQSQLLSVLRKQLRNILHQSDLCNGQLHAHKLESVYRDILGKMRIKKK
jgi:predicted O-linked N-acetylglucosamine transferase (SPINDLY family)